MGQFSCFPFFKIETFAVFGHFCRFLLFLPFLAIFRRFESTSELVKGGLLNPYRALFNPLDILYGIRFGPKNHVRTKLHREGLTDPFDSFLDLSGPWRNPKR